MTFKRLFFFLFLLALACDDNAVKPTTVDASDGGFDSRISDTSARVDATTTNDLSFDASSNDAGDISNVSDVAIDADVRMPQGDPWENVSPQLRSPDIATAALIYHDGRGTPMLFDLQVWEWVGTKWSRISDVRSDPQFIEYVYDESRDVVVGYGRPAANGVLPETWFWDGSWTKQMPAISPSMGQITAAAYDSVRDVIVLVTNNETWEWNGTNWNQATQTAPGRRRSNMAFDPARQRMVLFGGMAADALNDTWEYDGTGWSEIAPTSPPPGRSDFAMTYDPTRQAIVLYGGIRESLSRSDAYTWDGSNWQTMGSGYPARFEHGFIFDKTANQLFGYGGRTPIELTDTFAIAADDSWLDLSPNVDAPTGWWNGLAYDVQRDDVVFYGGIDATNPSLGETWIWDGTNWEQKFPTNSPGPLGYVSMAYHPERERVVLFGGAANGRSDATWEWDGNDWTYIQLVTNPPARTRHKMAYDAARQQIVMFGGDGRNGCCTDTWGYGTGGTWTQLADGTAPSGPSVPFGHTMAYDAEQELIFMENQGTWSWDGTAWTLVVAEANSGLPGLDEMSMAYDQVRKQLILVGGGTNAMYGFESGRWNRFTLTGMFPPGTNAHEMVFVDSLQKIILTNGENRPGTWLWDGSKVP